MDKMDYLMFLRDYLLACLGKLGGRLKVTTGNRLTTRLSLSSFFSFVSFNQSLVFHSRLC